jgi:hypothetical protein
MATKEKKKASRVVKGQELEVEHLTEISDVSPKQARALLRKHGADWPGEDLALLGIFAAIAAASFAIVRWLRSAYPAAAEGTAR